jgi:hypothetical protein
MLGGDNIFVNKIPFFTTISRNIKFRTVKALKNQKTGTILLAIKEVNRLYMKRGLKITHMLMDGQFKPLSGALSDLHINLNVVSNAEHVPEIERSNWTVKERMRCVYNTLPFKKMPACMIIEMVSGSVFWLNGFPPEDGILKTLSPRALIVGTHVDYDKHCRLEFGTYIKTHEEHDNSMIPCTTGAIAL